MILTKNFTTLDTNSLENTFHIEEPIFERLSSRFSQKVEDSCSVRHPEQLISG